MKARIEKKLSKKIASILPVMYKDSWVDDEISERSWSQGARVSHILSVGGELDCWGEGQDYCSVFEDFSIHYDWNPPIYNPYPDGHKWQGMPMPDQNRVTGKYLIECARKISAHNFNGDGSE